MSRTRSIAFSLVLALLLGATLAACIIQIGMDRVPRIGPLDELGATVALCAATAAVALSFALLIELKGPALVERVSKRNPLSRLRLQFPGAVNADAVSQIHQYQSAATTPFHCAPLLLGLLCNSLAAPPRQRMRRANGGTGSGADAHNVEEARR